MSSSMIWIGMDVHKDTVMVAVYRGDAREAGCEASGAPSSTLASTLREAAAILHAAFGIAATTRKAVSRVAATDRPFCK